MGQDLLKQRSGDFGQPRSTGNYELVTPVCVDALGETWAGYISQGPERGRMVLITSLLKADAPKNRSLLDAARDAATIRHPSVLAFLDVVESDTECLFVSEYLEGEPLGTLLGLAGQQSAPFSQGVALRIVLDVAEALVSLRSRAPGAIPFGGLCPEAIYVANYGEAMLRHPSVVASAMSTLSFRKHPSALPYRAPEQLRDPRAPSESADVFSLGVFLWELLAARPLFAGSSHAHTQRRKTLPAQDLAGIERKIRTEKIPSLATVPRPGGALHSAVVGLVERTLLREPALRPQSLDELVQNIRELPSGLLADSTEVASSVDRVAGRSIARRQRALASGAPGPVFGSHPPSERNTSRPEDDGRATLNIPRRADEPALQQLLRAADAEAPAPPTLRGASDGASTARRRSDSAAQTAPRRPDMASDPEAISERFAPEAPTANGRITRQLTPVSRPVITEKTPVASAAQELNLATPARTPLPAAPQAASKAESPGAKAPVLVRPAPPSRAASHPGGVDIAPAAETPVEFPALSVDGAPGSLTPTPQSVGLDAGMTTSIPGDLAPPVRSSGKRNAALALGALAAAAAAYFLVFAPTPLSTNATIEAANADSLETGRAKAPSEQPEDVAEAPPAASDAQAAHGAAQQEADEQETDEQETDEQDLAEASSQPNTTDINAADAPPGSPAAAASPRPASKKKSPAPRPTASSTAGGYRPSGI